MAAITFSRLTSFSVSALLVGFVSAFPVTQVHCLMAEEVNATSNPDRPGLVVVIRGFSGYWPGCDNYCRRVRSYHEYVTTYNTGLEARINTEEIAAEMQSGRWSQLRIVGYSTGADAAIEVARGLNQYGIRVERLVLIEPTNPSTIPGNVGYCYNIYESRPRTDWLPVFRGTRVQRESRRTALINYDVAGTRRSLTRLNHFDFSADPQVQAIAAFQAGAPSRTQAASVATPSATEIETSDTETPDSSNPHTAAEPYECQRSRN